MEDISVADLLAEPSQKLGQPPRALRRQLLSMRAFWDLSNFWGGQEPAWYRRLKLARAFRMWHLCHTCFWVKSMT